MMMLKVGLLLNPMICLVFITLLTIVIIIIIIIQT